MNISKLLSVAVVMLLVITGCEKSRNSAADITTLTLEAILNDIPTQENGNSHQVATRLDGLGFTAGDKIALMAVKYKADGGSNVLGADAITTYINEIYVHEGGQFQPFTTSGEKVRFYPSDGTNVDLYGVYYGEQTAAATDVTPFPFPYNAMPFSVQSIQTEANWYKSDLMMAKTVNCKQQITPNRMLFHHLLAKMEIRVKLDGYEDDVAVTAVRVVKMPTSATFNITGFDNGVVPITLSQSSGYITAQEMAVEGSSGFDFKAQAIVIPQTIARGTGFIEITLDTPNKDIYFLSIDEELLIEQGKNSVFNITITKGDLHNIKTTAIITPWGETNLENTTLSRRSEYRFKMYIEGNSSSPYNFAATSMIKVRVNGNRTYDLTRLEHTPASGGNPEFISFDFDGGGNSPSGGSFVMSSVVFKAARASATGVVDDITFNASTEVINELVYDVSTNIISTKI